MPPPTASDTVNDSIAPVSLLQLPPLLVVHSRTRGTQSGVPTAISTTVQRLTIPVTEVVPADSMVSRSSRQSERLLHLTRAKEEVIVVQFLVKFTAARISVLEAETQVKDEQNARTILYEEDAGAEQFQRISTSLSATHCCNQR